MAKFIKWRNIIFYFLQPFVLRQSSHRFSCCNEKESKYFLKKDYSFKNGPLLSAKPFAVQSLLIDKFFCNNLFLVALNGGKHRTAYIAAVKPQHQKKFFSLWCRILFPWEQIVVWNSAKRLCHKNIIVFPALWKSFELW